MSTPDEPFAVKTLYEWFQSNKKEFIALGAELEFKDSGHESAYVRLETKKYLMELCVWDHASCLDIQVIEIQSEKSSFPHVGSCESKYVFENYLREFIAWFNNEESKNT